RRASLRVKQQSDTTYDKTHETTRSVTSKGAARYLQLHQPMMLGGAPSPLPARLALKSSFSGCVSQLIINDAELSVVSSALGGVNVDNCEEIHNTTCRDSLCIEKLQPISFYPQNISENEIHHSIVAKKGLKLKYHKTKSKKHIEKYKRKKLNKKFDYLRSNEVITEGPYDGQTYM
ncbi:unnamed protein product, partial [Leptidea sinapis]